MATIVRTKKKIPCHGPCKQNVDDIACKCSNEATHFVEKIEMIESNKKKIQNIGKYSSASGRITGLIGNCVYSPIVWSKQKLYILTRKEYKIGQTSPKHGKEIDIV
jgi:hypothetical protein